MRTWRHSGFSIDNSVRIEAKDHAAMQRLVEYIARCPFSLARIISLTDDGKILYRTSAPNCIPFPKTGDNELITGNPRNFEIYKPLDLSLP
ncbi:MAG: transposase [Chitinispirillaceae bacterium]|nr:transposase [Chitinispirillaceae bacterium]